MPAMPANVTLPMYSGSAAPVEEKDEEEEDEVEEGVADEVEGGEVVDVDIGAVVDDEEDEEDDDQSAAGGAAVELDAGTKAVTLSPPLDMMSGTINMTPTNTATAEHRAMRVRRWSYQTTGGAVCSGASSA